MKTDTRRALVVLAEAGLVAVTLAAAVSFWRLFVDGSFLGPLVAFTFVTHALLIACRRLGLGLGASGVVAALGFGVAVAWVVFPATTAAGIPTGETWTSIRESLSAAWTTFQDVEAPAPVEDGFVIAAGMAVWVAAFIADWAAFRLWVAFEAVVPAGTLFVFASLLGADRGRVGATLLFLAAVLVFILCHRVARRYASSHWVSANAARGSNALLRVGAALVAATVGLSALLGPQMPGARAEAAIDWKKLGDNPAPRQTVSPFVTIRKQLIEQSSLELFTVEADRPAYWRVTSLDQFDGLTWTSKGSYSEAKGRLPRKYENAAQEAVTRQTYNVSALAALWLPAAFEARSVESEQLKSRWEAESSTLIVDTDFTSSDGATYKVESAFPVHDEAALASASPTVPDDVASRYLQLPQTLPDSVRQLAVEVTGAAASPYAKARALQDWFLANFEYSLEVPGETSSNAIEDFLLASRTGYCQQFAGSYAAMARAIGLPARVAVGFTWGEPDATNPNLYHVRGEYAHAWPEVYIAGYGWVSFEPTPGRGEPGREQYTGVAPQQAAPREPLGRQTLEAPPPSPVDTTAPEPTVPEGAPTQDVDTGGTGGPGGAPEPDRSLPGYVVVLLIASAVILGLALLYVVAVPTVHALRRQSRRQRATQPRQQVQVAWQESVEATSLLGVYPQASETPAEFAHRTQRVLRPGLWEPLANILEAADYSADGVDASDAAQAWQAATIIDTEVRAKAGWRERLRSLLDPRPYERRHRVRQKARRAKRGTNVPDIEVLAE